MELVFLLQTVQLVGPIPKAGAFWLLVLMVHFRVLFPHLQVLLLVRCQTIVLPYLTLLWQQAPPVLCSLLVQVSFAGGAHTPNVYSQDNLTKAVVRTLNQGSNVMSMDFHPQ
ncbi:uncharacterized protein LOC116144752 [Pistacia vera]|uniref:uncharacterized protein LOC116144752 n=1 Tax=Pistacia vera TaxID=55513 RepID=UPI001263D4D4|nr:uncharacterized protein LOC116144752 [Pistacia vera]XP_031286044.1 uncharacterized protein LOC116144752 [Pistacia vera]XP_031286045.1 uncharacterized protein LOC116144752 [Pistacia vera]